MGKGRLDRFFGVLPAHTGQQDLNLRMRYRPSLEIDRFFFDREANQGGWEIGHRQAASVLSRNFSKGPYLIPARRSRQIWYKTTVALTSLRQYSAISRKRASAISMFTSRPVTPWPLGDSIPNALQ